MARQFVVVFPVNWKGDDLPAGNVFTVDEDEEASSAFWLLVRGGAVRAQVEGTPAEPAPSSTATEPMKSTDLPSSANVGRRARPGE